MAEGKKESVFHKEADILAKAKMIVGDHNLTKEQLGDEYQELSNHFGKLLKETKVLTSVSDRLHAKLNEANHELHKQKDEIAEINEELTTNNHVLQDTINELIKARIGQKSSSIVLLIAIILFVVSEWMIEPIIEQNTDNEYTGLLLKGVIALLLKPIDVLVEWLLMRKTLAKMKKFEVTTSS